MFAQQSLQPKLPRRRYASVSYALQNNTVFRRAQNWVNVSLGVLVLLEAQTYHNFYQSSTNRSRFLVAFNILRYFVYQRLLVPFGLGMLLSWMFVLLCLLPTVLHIYTESFK